MKLIHHKFSTFAFTCLTLTALTFANGGTDKRVALVSTKDSAGIGLTRKNNAVEISRVLPSPGVGRADLSALGLSGEGLPNLTVESIRSLKVGDPMSIATPDGGSMDFVVSRRGWTGVDEKQFYFKQAETKNSLFGIISQIGPRLNGYFLRSDGSEFALIPAESGRYKLAMNTNPNPAGCGVGKVLPAHPVLGYSPTNLNQEGGIAGTSGVTPCPPEVEPFGLPPGLVKESGIVIDVLMVFSQDTSDLMLQQGTTPYEQATLVIAYANSAMKHSEIQKAVEFNGRLEDNQDLNDVCGYGQYPELGTVAVLADLYEGPAPPVIGPPPLLGPPLTLAPVSCADSDTDRAFHEALPGVSPYEDDVCLPRIRLVGALVADGFYGQEEPYISTGYAIDLSRLQNPGDGYLDYVQGWRDALGADAVCLVGLNYSLQSDFAGLANVMTDGIGMPGNPHPIVDPVKVAAVNGLLGPSDISTLQEFSESAFSIIECDLQTGFLYPLVFAHEFGHNLGCQHNHDLNGPQAPANAEDALFPDSFGFGDDDFRDIMAYPNGNIPVPGYSNPLKSWPELFGNPIGDDTTTGKAYDFTCEQIDGDGTDAEYRTDPPTGSQLTFNGPTTPVPVATPCTNSSDDLPNTSAVMVFPTDAQLEDAGKDCANNARSISQVKFDFAKFRCSIFPVVDCNDNEIDDYIEAVDGDDDSFDCNSDGIPDDCQVAVEDPGIPSPLDCNQNQVPDTCDIANGDSQDVNSNGLPDECEDQSLLFRENFENFPFGVNDGPLKIAKVGTIALAELRKLPNQLYFPEFFATIETDDQNPETEAGGFIYTDNIPSLFMYGLGQNGSFAQWNPVLRQGFAMAFGSKGYGQRLIFDSITGDFPSSYYTNKIGETTYTNESGKTTIILDPNRTIKDGRTSAKEARFYMNAADFTEYFDTEELYPGTYPKLIHFPFLQANVVTVQAFFDDDNGNSVMKFTQAYDLRSIQTPTFPTGFPTTVNDGGPVRIAQPFGQEPEDFFFNRVVILGAFVVIDNLSFDLGQVFPICPGDIAGGIPEGGLPTSDGRVGADDLVLVLALFTVDTIGNPLAEIADLNDDGFVDALDLLEILTSWGNCPGGAG